jgi:GNAT superfamily N-acetyltransferase
MNELERVEAQAVRDAVVYGGGRGELVGGAMCVQLPAVPMMELNRAIVLGAAVELDAIGSWFGGPHTIATHDEDLGRELASRGYTRARTWMKFERDGAPAPQVTTDARIEETLDGQLFGRLLGGGPELGGMVGAPGWRCFVGWIGDEPAACGALYADGTSAWLGAAFTLEQFRGRGLQSALLAARIEAARDGGTTLMASETGEQLPDQPATSYRNLQRAGFREAFLRANWTSPA